MRRDLHGKNDICVAARETVNSVAARRADGPLVSSISPRLPDHRLIWTQQEIG